jgi:hypothetical protein
MKNRDDAKRAKRPSSEGKMSAWGSLVIGLIACAYWTPLVLPQSTTWLPVAFVWYTHRWVFCCGEFVVPVFGIVLGKRGLGAGGYLRWLAWGGILLSLASEATYVLVLLYYLTHFPVRLGD